MEKKKSFLTVKEIKSDNEERIIKFIGTDETRDRTGEVLTLDGWKIGNYLKNPVFMWAHNYTMPSIGQTVKLTVDPEKGLIFDVKFPTREEYAFADTVYKLYKGGYLRAVSVGYSYDRTKNETDAEDGTVYVRDKELYELSAAPVPANPAALQIDMVKAVKDAVINEQEAGEFMLAAKDFLEKYGQKPEPDVTENYIRIRVKDPGLFIDSTFRTIDVSKADKIKAVAGKLKADGAGGSMVVQSYLFDKDKWTTARAQEWVREHKREQLPDAVKAETAEEKSGRVLSKENETLLRDAVISVQNATATISKVLDKINISEEPKSVPSLGAIYNLDFFKRAEPRLIEPIDSKLVDGIKKLHKE